MFRAAGRLFRAANASQFRGFASQKQQQDQQQQKQQRKESSGPTDFHSFMKKVQTDPELERRRNGKLTWGVVRLFLKRYLKEILWMVVVWLVQLLKWLFERMKYSRYLL